MTALVADASAVVELVRATSLGHRVHARIGAAGVKLHIPHLCPIEVASALRGLVLGNKLTPERASNALIDLGRLRARRHRVEPYLPRIWELRDNLTVYDATYVALAEALDATVVTTDGKTAPRYQHYARVDVIT